MAEPTPSETVRPRLVDWLVTPPFLIGFAGTLLLFDPLLRIARLFGQRPLEFVGRPAPGGALARVRLAGTRVIVERDPGVRPGVPYLVIANHQSLFDIPIFGALFFRSFPKFISKRELAKRLPSISFNLRRGGHAMIDRNDRAARSTRSAHSAPRYASAASAR